MKVKKLTLCFTASLFMVSFAHANTFQRCSEDLQNQLISQFKLDQSTQFKNIDSPHTSCLIIQPDKHIALIAISNVASKLDGDDGSYDLNLYTIDFKNSKVLNRYKASESIESDADHFDGISLDINPYSTLPNKNVVGFRIYHSHRGGFTYSYDSFYLFDLNSKYQIRSIFDGISTSDSGLEAMGNCPNNTSSEVKRILVLTKNISHGYQDILLKESKNQTFTDYKTCYSQDQHAKQQQLIKYDGKQYRLSHKNLFQKDPF